MVRWGASIAAFSDEVKVLQLAVSRPQLFDDGNRAHTVFQKIRRLENAFCKKGHA
jgi:hypothetical protein